MAAKYYVGDLICDGSDKIVWCVLTVVDNRLVVVSYPYFTVSAAVEAAEWLNAHAENAASESGREDLHVR